MKIALAKDHFSIEDNCGGIPRDVAKNYAFKMGREPDDNRDSDTETIGMYGVGMKRAIFKMGRDALVRTRHGDDTFEVPITCGVARCHQTGTRCRSTSRSRRARSSRSPGRSIHVNDLYEGVSRHFANEAFVNEVTHGHLASTSRCSSSGVSRSKSTASL